MRSILVILTMLVPLLIPATAGQLETDQFTVPPEPLADIGPEFDLKIDLVLRMLCNDANARGLKGETEDQRRKACDQFSRTLYDELANGIPECTIESWVRHADFRAKPSRFEVSVMKSVYGHTLIGRPITMFDLAPTVNLYGHYVGTDKVGHFFQQGYDYYALFRSAQDKGKSDQEALQLAVRKGVNQEEGIYGMFIIDTYSNADLATNIAGLMFYRNLTRPIRLGDATLPPILIYRKGRWDLNAMAGDHFLSHFVTDHWDESMNPSFYAPMLRHIVEGNVRDAGEKWVAFHHTNRTQEALRIEQMKTWYGLAYGHSDWKNVATIVNRYFDLHPTDAATASAGGGKGTSPVAIKH